MSIFGLKTILSKKNRLCRRFEGENYKIRYTGFLQPDRLRDEGLGFFGSWAANFGKTADQLNLAVPEAEFVITRAPASDAQKEMVDELSDRARQVRERLVEPEEDNMLKIVNDGRKLALDQRLMNPYLPDASNIKVNICIKNVLDVYESTKEQQFGRIIRQDNENKRAKIFKYVTEGTFDAYTVGAT